MSGGLSVDADLARRVTAALRDAEAWTAKYCADNHERVEPGMPFEAAAAQIAETANGAPQCEWFSATLACGTRRQRLYVDGRETPFFIDSAKGVSAHKSQGEEHGLYGAGMAVGERSGRPMAAHLGCGPKITILKHRAEQMALPA